MQRGLLALTLVAPPLWGVDPNVRMTQYAHSAWRVQDGVIDGEPTAIAQTSDGYIWIGTENGLLRFDGVRFVPWATKDGQRFSKSVFSLLAAPDGSLWIGTGSGIAEIKDDALKALTNSSRVNAIIRDKDGTIWYTRSRVHDNGGPLCKVAGNDVQCYDKSEGVPFSYAEPLLEDALGNLWIGSSTALLRWKTGFGTSLSPKLAKSNEGLRGVAALALGPNGSLWVGLGRKGAGLGLQRFDNGRWTSFRTANFDGDKISVASLYRDTENTLWVGTDNQGIYRIRGDEVDHFTSADGLSDDTVNAFLEDREGNMWMLTTRGVESFRNLKVISITAHEGLSFPVPGPLLAARDGTVWIGNDGAVDKVWPDQVHAVQSKDALPGQRVTSLYEDRDGQIWIGTDRGLFAYAHGKYTPIRSKDGSSLGLVLSVAQDTEGVVYAAAWARKELVRIEKGQVREELKDPAGFTASFLLAASDGGIWLGLANGELARYLHGHVEVFHYDNGQKPGVVHQLLVSPNGELIGVTATAVVGLHSGRLQLLTTSNGLPCNAAYGLVFDSEQNLWLYTQCGLVKIAADDLKNWWEHPDAHLPVSVLDALDGVQPSLAPFVPTAVRSLDGRLWFANESVVQVLDPHHLTRNPVVPPVHIEEVIANRKGYPPNDALRLPPRIRDLEIDYTALSFVNPAKVHFRYMLEGHDEQWEDAGTRRQAFYTDLRPGHYRFHVIASNNDGLWNEAGSTLSFSVAPAYYQTKLFIAMWVALAICLLMLLHWLRMRYAMNALSARFDERLAERTRIARELHDTLLQTIEGSKLVADDALDQSDPSRLRTVVEQLSEWLGRAIDEGRAALHSLRTSTTETNDLAEGLRRATEECRMFSPMSTSLSVQGEAQEMHPVVRDEIYRIAYEAIRNACVHSKASQLHVELSYAHDLIIHVRDNGVGISPAFLREGKGCHFGLTGMRERAERIGAKLKISSNGDSGTDIMMIVPGRIAFLHASKDPTAPVSHSSK